MAEDAGHGNRTGAPWVAEIEVEYIVLHKPVSIDGDLDYLAYNPFSFRTTYHSHGAPRQVLSHGLCDGRLFSHAEYLIRHVSTPREAERVS